SAVQKARRASAGGEGFAEYRLEERELSRLRGLYADGGVCRRASRAAGGGVAPPDQHDVRRGGAVAVSPLADQRRGGRARVDGAGRHEREAGDAAQAD